ncbi:MAG: hypothetical protein ABI614_16615 [Planctomycetota bacterium]
MAATETEVFDTHPCFKDRVANAMQEQTPGVFRLELPVAELFIHFDVLCRNVTSDMYRDLLRAHVLPEHMQPIDGLIMALQKQAAPTWE